MKVKSDKVSEYAVGQSKSTIVTDTAVCGSRESGDIITCKLSPIVDLYIVL